MDDRTEFSRQQGVLGGIAPRETNAPKKSNRESNKPKTNKKGKQKGAKENDDVISKQSYAEKKQEAVGSWKQSLKKGEIPDPVPQKTTKKDFLNGIDFGVVDQHALTAPKSLLSKSFWELIQYLTGDDVFDDLVRVRAIYRWITSFDIQCVDVGPDTQPDTPSEYFSKIQCHMGNVANLFYILCTMAEVPCKVIDGITKNEDYHIGDPESTEMKSQWNAVYVQKEWRLLDVFWAKSCVLINSGNDNESMQSLARSIHAEDADEEYFFTDAEDLIWTHFPDDDKWQLLKKPMAKNDFLEWLYVRERSREMGITYPKKNGMIKVVDGRANFEVNFPLKRGENYHFKHNFTRMIPDGEFPRRLDKILHHFILFERLEDKISFIFNIPVLGKFKVNIFASDPGTDGLEKFDLVCSIVVWSSELAKECLPLPDYPKIGWGPTRISRRLGLIPITHEESSIYTTSGVLQIEIGAKESLKLEMKLVNPYIDNTNTSKYAMLYWNHGRYIVKTRLPHTGIYGLKFFRKNLETMEQENVLNYLIHCSMKKGKIHSLPHIAQDMLGAHSAVEQLGVVATVHQSGYIETKDGHTSVEFLTKPDVELIGELHSNDPEAIPRMRINPYKKGAKHGFALDVPIQGEYGFNVYAIKKGEPQKLMNAYSFLVVSFGRQISVGTVKNKALEKNFNKLSKEIKTESIKTIENEVSIPVPRGIDNLLAFLQKADRSEPQNSQSVQRLIEKGIDIYKVTLHDLGDYSFNVFQQEQKCLRLVSKYLITRNEVMHEIEDDAKEVLEVIKEERQNAGTDVSDMERYMTSSRNKTYVDVDRRIQAAQRLTESLKSNDPEMIRKALLEYQYNQSDEKDDLIINSKKHIKMLQAKYDLLRAYKARELTSLDLAIVNATAANGDRSFDQLLIHAKRLRDRLAALRTMQDMARNTDNRMIGELRQYKTPPVGVHQTVMAALMLLGYDPSDIKTWKQCQKILGQHGEKSFLSQMSNYDPKDADLALAFEAKKTVEPYTTKQVHAGSHEAASIFIWVEQMVKDIEASAGTLGVSVMVPEHGPAKMEIEKEPLPIPNTEEKKKSGKPTVVTLESLLIDPNMLEPSYDRHNRIIKSKNVKKPKEQEQIKANNDNRKVNDITPRHLDIENKRESKSRDSKPKNFIAKNIKTSKAKCEEDKSASYLSTYRKKQDDIHLEEDNNSVDGHLSIPEDYGKPGRLVGGSYHGDNPLTKLSNNDSKDNNDDDKANKKRYKDIYHRRKDGKEAIDRLWATSVKAK